jgi:hypothetical protein
LAIFKKIWKPIFFFLTSLSGKKKKSWDIIFGADIVDYKQQLHNEHKIEKSDKFQRKHPFKFIFSINLFFPPILHILLWWWWDLASFLWLSKGGVPGDSSCVMRNDLVLNKNLLSYNYKTMLQFPIWADIWNLSQLFTSILVMACNLLSWGKYTRCLWVVPT